MSRLRVRLAGRENRLVPCDVPSEGWIQGLVAVFWWS
jgi:hypothetical protein